MDHMDDSPVTDTAPRPAELLDPAELADDLRTLARILLVRFGDADPFDEPNEIVTLARTWFLLDRALTAGAALPPAWDRPRQPDPNPDPDTLAALAKLSEGILAIGTARHMLCAHHRKD